MENFSPRYRVEDAGERLIRRRNDEFAPCHRRPRVPIINLTIFNAARKGHLSREVIIYETWINAISCDAPDATVLSKFTEANSAARFSGLLRRRKGAS